MTTIERILGRISDEISDELLLYDEVYPAMLLGAIEGILKEEVPE